MGKALGTGKLCETIFLLVCVQATRPGPSCHLAASLLVLLRELPRVQVGSSQPSPPPQRGAPEAGPEGAGLGERLGGRSSEELWPQPGWALLPK